jgi:hypothetical protein
VDGTRAGARPRTRPRERPGVQSLAAVHQPWLEILARFDADRRLIRIAGNHDIGLQEPELLAVLRERLPNVEQAYDAVVLEDGQRAPFVILHGHQFDLASHLELAPRFGELYSESTAIWFQGPGPAPPPRPAPRPLARARRDAYSAAGQGSWAGYFNTGAAGRFENLVWAVEIENGEGRVVSWNRGANGRSERREWRAQDRVYLSAFPGRGLIR